MMGVINGKIWPPYETFYIEGMLFNCKSAIRSIDRISDAFEKLPQEISEEDILKLPVNTILNEFQNVTIQGAALSRYFWPVRNEHEDRGLHLRKSLDIVEGNPLQARELRNAIEHFDERLDIYLASGMVGYIFPEFVGARPQEDGVQGHFFRAYFIDCGIFKLLDGEYQMEPIIEEILRINDVLITAVADGGRLRSAE